MAQKRKFIRDSCVLHVDHETIFDDSNNYPFEYEPVEKKLALESSSNEDIYIFFKDEDNNKIKVTPEDLGYIVQERRFPPKMKTLSVNGEFEIDSAQEPYRTTFTDKIEFDAKDLSVHSNNLCSVSIAEVSWLGARELRIFRNTTSTIADQIIRSYKWNGYYIVARHKNNYSLNQYIDDLRKKKTKIMKPHQVIRKLGQKIRHASKMGYVVRQIFCGNISISSDTVKFHELGILSHLKRMETDSGRESESELIRMNKLSINEQNNLNVEYMKIKDIKSDEQQFFLTIAPITSRAHEWLPKYFTTLYAANVHLSFTSFVTAPWLSDSHHKLKEYVSKLYQLIKRPKDVKCFFRSEIIKHFKNKTWICNNSLKKNKYCNYDTADVTSFIRYLRNMFAHTPDFLYAHDLTDEKELFEDIIELNYELLLNIHEYCCYIRSYMPDDEYKLLKRFISVNDCDFD